MDDIVLPRAFEAYRCQRTLMCCRAPIRAQLEPGEEETMRAELAQSERGRAYLPRLEGTLEPLFDDDDRPVLHLWRHTRGRCHHLDEGAGACAVHAAGGLGALPRSCRNFPRVIQAGATPDAPWHMTFELGCPTAARLLAADPKAYTLITRPRPSEGYTPARAPLPPADRAQREALRDAWWAHLARVRDDAPRLVAALGEMLDDPLDVPAADAAPRLLPAVGAPAHSLVALQVVNRLPTLPGRADLYGPQMHELHHHLVQPWPPERLVLAASATPHLVAAFVEHELGALLFLAATPEVIVRRAARRALMVLRIAEHLRDRVPLRIAAIFADAYTAVTPTVPEP